MDRLKKMHNWADLTGKDRLNKEWLNGMPRIIFLNDMCDTFSKGLPEDWFAEALPILAKYPHIFLVLSKWPKRFAAFSQKYELPPNVCAGTSVTSQDTVFRIKDLLKVRGGSFKWVSFEPLWSDIKYPDYVKQIDWAIFGGESGRDAQECNVDWIRNGVNFCQQNNITPFVKQLGKYPRDWGNLLTLKDGHGGDINEWPDSLNDIKVREFPKHKLANHTLSTQN